MRLVLLTVFFGLGSTLTIDNCPQNLPRDKYLQVFGQSCFKFHGSGHLDFPDARALCRKSNGTLAMPKTKTINDFLAKQLSQYGIKDDTWIGLNDLREEDEYIWEDNTPLYWDNFGDYEGPQNSYLLGNWENCIAMTPSSGIWRDHHCDFLAKQLSQYGIKKDTWIGLNDLREEDEYIRIWSFCGGLREYTGKAIDRWKEASNYDDFNSTIRRRMSFRQKNI